MVKKIMLSLFLVGVAVPASSLVAADRAPSTPRGFWSPFCDEGIRFLEPFSSTYDDWAMFPKGLHGQLLFFRGRQDTFDTSLWGHVVRSLEGLKADPSCAPYLSELDQCICLFKRLPLYNSFLCVLKKIFAPRVSRPDPVFSQWLAEYVFGEEAKVKSSRDSAFDPQIGAFIGDSFPKENRWSTSGLIERLRVINSYLISSLADDVSVLQGYLEKAEKDLAASKIDFFLSDILNAAAQCPQELVSSRVCGAAGAPSAVHHLSSEEGVSATTYPTASMPLAVAASAEVSDASLVLSSESPAEPSVEVVAVENDPSAGVFLAVAASAEASDASLALSFESPAELCPEGVPVKTDLPASVFPLVAASAEDASSASRSGPAPEKWELGTQLQAMQRMALLLQFLVGPEFSGDVEDLNSAGHFLHMLHDRDRSEGDAIWGKVLCSLSKIKTDSLTPAHRAHLDACQRFCFQEHLLRRSIKPLFLGEMRTFFRSLFQSASHTSETVGRWGEKYEEAQRLLSPRMTGALTDLSGLSGTGERFKNANPGFFEKGIPELFQLVCADCSDTKDFLEPYNTRIFDLFKSFFVVMSQAGLVSGELELVVNYYELLCNSVTGK